MIEIELDEARKAAQLESITGSDYFRELRDQAEGLRGLASGQE